MENIIKEQYNQNVEINLLPSPKTGITEWELDKLLITKLRENYNNTSATLLQFTSLLSKLENIPIPDDINNIVQDSISHAYSVPNLIKEKKYNLAYQSSKKSFSSAEKAFFYHDMIGSLYFPQEHKYAIYLPLFLPLTFPLLSGVSEMISKWRNRK